MPKFLEGWVEPLIHFHYIVVGFLLVGFIVWARATRRHPHQMLSWCSRLALAALLAATPCAWWLSAQSLQRRTYFSQKLDAAAYGLMRINRAPDDTNGERVVQFTGDDGKPFLFMHAPCSLTFLLRTGDHRLEMDYGFMRSAYSQGGRTNGAILQITIKSSTGRITKLFEYYATPVEREADRNLLHAVAEIPPHQPGDQLMVGFLVGNNNDNSWDHTFIRRLVLE